MSPEGLAVWRRFAGPTPDEIRPAPPEPHSERASSSRGRSPGRSPGRSRGGGGSWLDLASRVFSLLASKGDLPIVPRVELLSCHGCDSDGYLRLLPGGESITQEVWVRFLGKLAERAGEASAAEFLSHLLFHAEKRVEVSQTGVGLGTFPDFDAEVVGGSKRGNGSEKVLSQEETERASKLLGGLGKMHGGTEAQGTVPLKHILFAHGGDSEGTLSQVVVDEVGNISTEES